MYRTVALAQLESEPPGALTHGCSIPVAGQGAGQRLGPRPGVLARLVDHVGVAGLELVDALRGESLDSFLPHRLLEEVQCLIRHIRVGVPE